MSVERLASRLRAIVGPRGVLTRESELLAYSADGLPTYRKRPPLAVFPATREELVRVVRLLAEERRPFVPRGADELICEPMSAERQQGYEALAAQIMAGPGVYRKGFRRKSG